MYLIKKKKTIIAEWELNFEFLSLQKSLTIIDMICYYCNFINQELNQIIRDAGYQTCQRSKPKFGLIIQFLLNWQIFTAYLL